MSSNVYHDFFDVCMNFLRQANFSTTMVRKGNEQAVMLSERGEAI